jgi:hypothetical protein
MHFFGAGERHESLTVSCAEHAPHLTGTYRKVADTKTADRPVYKRVGSRVKYLFFSSNNNEWRIGHDYLSDSISATSDKRRALRPEDSTGWQVWNGEAWVSKPIRIVPTGAAQPPRNHRCIIIFTRAALD